MREMVTQRFYRVINADRRIVTETSSVEQARSLLPKGGEIKEVNIVSFWNDGSRIKVEVEDSTS